MTDEQMQELVKESGLDWHRGYMPLFDGDPTNRYTALIEAVVAAERERLAKLAEQDEDNAGFHSLSASEIRAGCRAS